MSSLGSSWEPRYSSEWTAHFGWQWSVKASEESPVLCLSIFDDNSNLSINMLTNLSIYAKPESFKSWIRLEVHRLIGSEEISFHLSKYHFQFTGGDICGKIKCLESFISMKIFYFDDLKIFIDNPPMAQGLLTWCRQAEYWHRVAENISFDRIKTSEICKTELIPVRSVRQN